MNITRSNILITGLPGCGKTTLLRRVIDESGLQFSGFLTDEIRKNGQRLGFRLDALDGETFVLALKGLNSRHSVGAYGVDLEQFEIFLRKKEPNILNSRYVVIDEIGKMELFSQKFRNLLGALLDSPKFVLASIIHKAHPYADKIKQRDDVRLLNLNKVNNAHIKIEIENNLNAFSLAT